jgi:hypothetical protein
MFCLGRWVRCRERVSIVFLCSSKWSGWRTGR